MASSMLTRRRLVVVVILVVALLAFAIVLAVAAIPLAEQRALDAEDAYVTAQLENESCLTDWGTREGAATKRVEATGVGLEGIRVEVSLPYAHTTEQDGETIYADSASEAVYRVTLTDAHRVQGDDISPC